MQKMLRERKATRLKGFDYSTNNLYFVTSCVQDRICCFGEITDGTMYLNTFGKIVKSQWIWLARQYPYVKLHAFIVMPNHVHGIIEINRDIVLLRFVGNGRDHSLQTGSEQIIQTNRDHSLQTGSEQTIQTNRDHSLQTGPEQIIQTNRDHSMQTGPDQSLQSDRDQSLQHLKPTPSVKIKSLSELIGAFKTTSSKQIHLAGLTDFVWQKSFYDHIIRNEIAFRNISKYIQNNPRDWNEPNKKIPNL